MLAWFLLQRHQARSVSQPGVGEQTPVPDPRCKPKPGTFLNETHESRSSQKITNL